MKHWRFLLVLLLAVFSSACAEDVGTIDRTQPNRIKKTYFDGEWFMRQTVVDVPFNTGFTFIGEQSSTYLVQWDIQEKYLIAYKTYEHNPGSDAYATNKDGKPYGTVCEKGSEVKVIGYNESCPSGYEETSKKAFYGTPVAAYAIDSHFDIKRQYNSSTGEQTNVIIENTSDRPWYERDYIRIDWAENLIANFEFGSPNKIPQQPVTFYCAEDPNDLDDHCKKWQPYFADDASYFYIVNKVLAQPETFDYYGTKYPTCYLYSNMGQDCLGQEITYKTDFMKKRIEDYAYQTVDFNDLKMKKFGYFRTEKYVYDKDRGFLEEGIRYYANIFDIFKRDTEGNPVGVKPIVYYMSDNMPEELQDAARWLAEGRTGINAYSLTGKENEKPFLGADINNPGRILGWNDAFKKVAAEVLGDKYKGEDVFIMCHNPVKNSDPLACGDRGLNPQIGDLRYNIVYWVANPQASSPLGYGPNAPDPVTGKVISGNAFIYGNELENYAQYVLDLVDLLNGEIEVSEFVSGRYIAQYLETKNSGDLHSKSFVNVNKKIDIKNAMDKLQPKVDAIRDAIRDKRLTTKHFSNRLELIKNTGIEDSLISQDVKALFNPAKDYVEMPITQEQKDILSPANWLSPKMLKKREELGRLLAKKTIMMNDFVEDSMLGMALYLKESEMTKEQMFQYIQKEIFFGTAIHEIGHTVGLRHNFASHTDALNFFPEYWNIRLDQLDDGTNFSTTGLQPRYREAFEDGFDAMVERQDKKGIFEYQYTSIMDYGGRPQSDFKGLGMYDVAAIMFAYGNKIQVFDNSENPDRKWTYIDGEKNWETSKYRHYTRTLYELISLQGITSATYRNSKDLNIEALYKHRKWVDYKDVLDEKFLKDKNGSDGLVEVPYAFCSDEYHSGNYKCYRFAAGVDMYESMVNQQSYYENWYFLNNFKRGRSSYGTSTGPYMARLSRTFDFIGNQFKHWVYEGLIARDPSDGWYGRVFDGEDLTIGSYQSLDFFAKVLASVDPGFYSYNSATGYYEKSAEKDYFYGWNQTPATGQKEIPLGFGKFQSTKYDPSLGYNYYYQPVAQGVWLDKVIALFTLGDDMTNYMGVDASADMLSYAISYTSIFSEDIMRMVGAIVLDRPELSGVYFHHVGGSAANAVLTQPKGILLWNSDGSDYQQNKANYKYVKNENPFLVKLYGVYLAAAYFTEVTRFDFGKSLEINVLGSGNSNEFAVPLDDPTVQSVVDPISHKTYYSVNLFANSPTAEDELPLVSIGYELLSKLKNTTDAYNQAKAEYESGTGSLENLQEIQEKLQEERTYVNFVVSVMNLFKHPYW